MKLGYAGSIAALCIPLLCGAACSDESRTSSNGIASGGMPSSGGGGLPGTDGSGRGAAGSTGAVTGAGGASGGIGAVAGTGGSADSANASGAAATGGAAVGRDAGVANGSGGAGSSAQGGSRGQSQDSGTAGADGPAPVECPATVLQPGETNATVQVGGVTRTFILYVPQSYTGKAAVPFVTDWHPLMAYGAAEEAMSGYKELADQEGFVIAWPDALEGGWNIGPCCTSSGTVDDLGFARAIVTDVESRACIDPKRVYATGISMGGGMSHYLACNAADIFAAVAPAAFDLLTEDEEPCHPAHPITVISFRGTSDPVVPYAGGESSPPNGLAVTIHLLGAEGTFEKWSKLDGCTGTPTDGGNGCQTYTQCKQGVEVTLCSQQGGGHDPGDPQLGWAMMKKHPMP